MFSKKKNKADWPLLIFGAVAIGIVIAIAVLILLIVSKAHDSDGSVQPVDFLPNADSTSDPRENYKKELLELQGEISSADNLADLFSRVEKFFVTMRVPAEKRDEHLQVLLNVLRLKREDKGLGEMKGELLNLLDSLMN